MQTKIYSESAGYGKISIFIIQSGLKYSLFEHEYKKGISSYFSRGVSLEDAIDRTKANKNTVVLRAMEKVLKYIRRVEKEEGVVFLQKKAQKKYKHTNYLRSAYKMELSKEALEIA